MNKVALSIASFLIVAGCAAAKTGSLVPAATPTGLSTNASTVGKSAAYPVVNVMKDCGAWGDGKTNDSAAFQKAADLINKAGGGTLVIPKAVYIVGQQEHEAGKSRYYQSRDVFALSNVKFLLIDGHGATLRLEPGLRYGSFDKETGQIYTPKMPFYDPDYIADVKSMISVTKSENVTIRNLELDGNSGKLLLGGLWGDVGRQLGGSGIFLYNNCCVQISKVNSHHQALDGIMIGWTGLKATGAPTPHTLTDCSFEYNGRQGLSWVGGRGLKAVRCKFNHTQRSMNNGAPIGSSPGAGVDIEAEDSVDRDGDFQDCEFMDNGGAGVVADSGDGGYSHFARCTFWGTTYWSAWNGKPGLKYQDCNFYGAAVHTVGSPDPHLATGFLRCHFEDKPWTNGKVYREGGSSGGFLLDTDDGGDNVSFDTCSFIANANKSIWFGAGKGLFNNCTFLHKWAGAPDNDFQALIHVATLSGCHFTEEFPADTKKNWFIALGRTVTTKENPTVVDGPHIHWAGPGGPIGEIKPGSYNS